MFLRTSLRATALASLLSISLGAWAQASEAGLSDQERAKRDAGKVFNFIKFHAVRSAKPADKAAEKPAEKAADTRVAAAPAPAPAPRRAADAQVASQDAARPAAEGVQTQVAQVAQVTQVAQVAPAAAPAAGLAAPSASRGMVEPGAQAANPVASGAVMAPAAALVAAPSQPAPSVTPTPEPEPEEETGLQLVEYVEPELPRANNVTTLKGGTVTVRFEVGTDGKVVSAVPRDGAPRRLAQAAARAVQQWRFAPLSAAREAEVDIVFNLE